MNIIPTKLSGLLRLKPFCALDQRGSFMRLFQRDEFATQGLATTFAEEYVTTSRARVLRGMHFQTPPQAQIKLVHCAAGRVFDVVIDLRRRSSTYGQHAAFELSPAEPEILYVPAGFAHGFCVLEAPAIMVYKVTDLYSKPHDAGIRWDSAGIAWPTTNPILSERDRSFPTLAEFVTPFE